MKGKSGKDEGRLGSPFISSLRKVYLQQFFYRVTFQAIGFGLVLSFDMKNSLAFFANTLDTLPFSVIIVGSTYSF